MYSLLIDTHLDNIHVVLFCDGKIILSDSRKSEQNHSSFTLPMIEEVLRKVNLEINQVDELIVVNGPGSFTGVRIGVTLAKTIAFAQGSKIKTINSLQIQAISVNVNDPKTIILSDKNGKYIGEFDGNNALIGELKYLKNDDYRNYKTEYKIYENVKLDFERIYEYTKSLLTLNAHEVNPLYIKNIEVSSGKRSSN